jgi:hypothetical protein
LTVPSRAQKQHVHGATLPTAISPSHKVVRAIAVAERSQWRTEQVRVVEHAWKLPSASEIFCTELTVPFLCKNGT